MPKRYRLLARAEVDGAVRDPGYVFTLPLDAEGNEVLGPHKTVEHSADRIDLSPDGDGNRIPGKVKDVPLYEELPDDAELSPTVDRSAGVRAHEMAMAGGSRVVEDEQEAAAVRRDRRAHLDSKGNDLTDEERKERDELREQVKEPHETPNHPAHVEHPEPQPRPQPDATHHEHEVDENHEHVEHDRDGGTNHETHEHDTRHEGEHAIGDHKDHQPVFD